MKTTTSLAVIMLILFGLSVFPQNPILPDVKLYRLDGSLMSANSIQNDGKVMVILFWDMDSRESLEQVRMINEEYENELQYKNIRIVSICSGSTGNTERIKPYVNGTCLGFDVYIDRNNDLKRAMSIPQLPYILVINQPGNSYRYSGLCLNLGELIDDQVSGGLAKNK